MIDYALDGVSPEVSFLEMMDQLNEKLIKEVKIPSPLITTAAKASVVCVGWSLMDRLRLRKRNHHLPVTHEKI